MAGQHRANGGPSWSDAGPPPELPESVMVGLAEAVRRPARLTVPRFMRWMTQTHQWMADGCSCGADPCMYRESLDRLDLSSL